MDSVGTLRLLWFMVKGHDESNKQMSYRQFEGESKSGNAKDLFPSKRMGTK